MKLFPKSLTAANEMAAQSGRQSAFLPSPDNPYYKVARQAALPSAMTRATEDVRMVNETLNRVDGFQPSPVLTDWVEGQRPSSAASVAMLHEQAHAPLPVEPGESELPTPLADPLVQGDQADSDAWLHLVAPASRTEFRLARRRIEEAADAVGDEQAGLLAQAMESLRRALSKLADQLYPAGTGGAVETSLGEELKADDRAYVNRLFLALDSAGLDRRRRKLERIELEDFHRRFYALNARLGDNVHRDGEFEECKTLYLDAWRVARTCRVFIPSAA